MLARGSGAWFKNTLFVVPPGGSSIVSMPQKACSALLRGFESRSRDREPEFRDFDFNEEALQLNELEVLSFRL